MATNLAIDDELLEQAREVGGHSGTKKETVTEALKVEYIQASQAASAARPLWHGRVRSHVQIQSAQRRRS